MLHQISCEPPLAERRPRLLAGKRLGAAGLEKDRVKLPGEPFRQIDVGPAPDGDRGTEIGLGFRHHAMVPASEDLRYLQARRR
jgi:hypothetical protein